MDIAAITSYIQLISALLVSVTGLMVAIVGLIKPIRRWFVNLFKNYNNTEITKKQNDLEQSLNKVTEFIDKVNVDLTTKFERDKAEQALIKEATIALLRNDMTAIYNEATDKGYIGDWDRENFEHMYVVYNAMGGNSYIKAVHEKIISMPRTLPQP